MDTLDVDVLRSTDYCAVMTNLETKKTAAVLVNTS